MNIGIVDTHAHLNDARFKEDWADMHHRALEQGVVAAILPNVDLETLPDVHKHVSTKPNWCFGMLGLHPCSVEEHWQEQLNDLWQHSNQLNWVGVGEIGLDLYWDKTSLGRQQDALDWQLIKANEMELPVCLHTRNAHVETVSTLKRLRPSSGGVFHCFTGNYAEAVQVFDLDMYIGIGGVVTYKQTELREVLAKVGLNRVVLETDSPYLPPVPHRGKRNEPSWLTEVVHAIAQACRCHPQHVIETTFQNAVSVYPKLQNEGV